MAMNDANDSDLREEAQKEWELVPGWEGKPGRYLDGEIPVQLGKSSVSDVGWWQLDIGCGDFRPRSSMSTPQPGEDVGRKVSVWVESWLLSTTATSDVIDACGARAIREGSPSATWLGIGRVTQEYSTVSEKGRESFHFKMLAKDVPALNRLCLTKAKARIVAFFVKKAPEEPKLQPGEQPLPGILDPVPPVPPPDPVACDDDGVVSEQMQLPADVVLQLGYDGPALPQLPGPDVIDTELVEDGELLSPTARAELLRDFLFESGGEFASYQIRMRGPEGLKLLSDRELSQLAASSPDLFVVTINQYHEEVIALASPSVDDLELVLLASGLRDKWRGAGWIQDQLRITLNCTHKVADAWRKRVCAEPKRFRRREGMGFEAVEAADE